MQEFCDESFRTLKTFETQYGYLWYDCCDRMENMLEEERRNDWDSYCLSCGDYSEIIVGDQCPACFESGGYIGYRRSLTSLK